MVDTVGCLSWRKDKNFKANHNQSAYAVNDYTDVCLGAKIRILKQITTIDKRKQNCESMFVLAQR